MKRLVLIAALALAVLTLGLCSGPVLADTPVQGGILRYPIPEPGSLDPAQLSYINDVAVGSQIFDGLTQLDQNLSVIPAVAASWSSPDARIWAFSLRHDVYFHNGRLVKAADFVYSWERARDAGGPYVGMFDNVQSFAATGDFTFTVTLNNPLATFPIVAALPVFTVIPSETVSLLDAKPVGTGPFRVITWTRGSRIILQANPSYYGGAPYLDGVEYKFYETDTAQWAAFQTGEVDLTQIPASQWSAVSGDPNVITGTAMSVTGYGLDLALLPNINLRKGLQRAIDRAAIASDPAVWPYQPAVRLAHGVVVLPKGGYDASAITIPYTPTEALALLADAGWADTNHDGILDNGLGAKLTIVVQDSTSAGGHAVAQAVAGNLSNIGGTGVGAEVSLTTTQSASHFRRLGWISDYPDPENDLLPYETGKIFASRIHYGSVIFDGLLAAGRVSLSETARNALFEAADATVVLTDAVALPIYYGSLKPVLKRPYVSGLRPSNQADYMQPLRYVWLNLPYRVYLPVVLRNF
jgi:ABC-type transport system substrate-binding protein